MREKKRRVNKAEMMVIVDEAIWDIDGRDSSSLYSHDLSRDICASLKTVITPSWRCRRGRIRRGAHRETILVFGHGRCWVPSGGSTSISSALVKISPGN